MDPPWIDGPPHWGDPEYEKAMREGKINMIDSFTGQYRFLSNFYLCRVRYMSIPYRSAEHAYQVSKTNKSSERRAIRQVRTTAQAKKLGRQTTLRKDWDEVKVQMMQAIVKSKFEQNPELRRRLLATFDIQLVEGNSWHDTFWGVCDGEGENHLGRILMTVRGQLR